MRARTRRNSAKVMPKSPPPALWTVNTPEGERAAAGSCSRLPRDAGCRRTGRREFVAQQTFPGLRHGRTAHGFPGISGKPGPLARHHAGPAVGLSGSGFQEAAGFRAASDPFPLPAGVVPEVEDQDGFRITLPVLAESGALLVRSKRTRPVRQTYRKPFSVPYAGPASFGKTLPGAGILCAESAIPGVPVFFFPYGSRKGKRLPHPARGVSESWFVVCCINSANFCSWPNAH